MDTIKTHLQCERCGSTDPLKTWKCAKTIVGREGLMRLWRGVSATFAGCVPAHAAYFSIFESLKLITGADKDGHHPMRAALCGAGAALSHDLFMTPFDTVKQRMQLGYYNSTYHCTRSIMQGEGMRALYVALPATLLMNLPYGMIMVATNESCKTYLNPGGGYSFSTSMVAGSVAGGVAAALTTPLDIVKTRLQTNNLLPSFGEHPLGHVPSSSSYSTSTGGRRGTNPTEMVKRYTSSGTSGTTAAGGPRLDPRSTMTWLYESTAEAARTIWKEAGVGGYFRGVVPRVLVHSPAVAISWTAYEAAKSALTTTSRSR